MLFPSGSFGLHCYTLELATLKLFTGGFRAPSVEAAKAPAKALEWGLPSSRMALLRTSKESYAEAMPNEGDISHEEAIDPLVADARNFYIDQPFRQVATPILDKRPNPVGPEERARMVQAEDCADLIRYIACLPKHVVMSEVMLAPTHNRTYLANLQQKL